MNAVAKAAERILEALPDPEWVGKQAFFHAINSADYADDLAEEVEDVELAGRISNVSFEAGWAHLMPKKEYDAIRDLETYKKRQEAFRTAGQLTKYLLVDDGSHSAHRPAFPIIPAGWVLAYFEDGCMGIAAAGSPPLGVRAIARFIKDFELYKEVLAYWVKIETAEMKRLQKLAKARKAAKKPEERDRELLGQLEAMAR